MTVTDNLPRKDILPHMESACKAAGAAILEHYGNDDIAVTVKENGDKVCDADLAAEAILISALAPLIPDAAILSEESGSQDTASPWRWVMDPLDGTVNFLQHIPWFCTSLALEHVPTGRLQAGVVYDPLHDHLYSAWHGAGAYKNHAPIMAQQAAAPIMSISPKTRARGDLHEHIITRADHMPNRFLGACALDLCHVATGNISIAVIHDARLWDVAGGEAIIREAGGAIEQMKNSYCATHVGVGSLLEG